MISPDGDYRPNPNRAVYVQGQINQALVDRLTPKILKLQHESRDPISVYIDSQGGSTLLTDTIRRLLTTSNQDNAPPCRIITVVTSRAASAAADLLSAGDYAVAYQEATIFYHGVRVPYDVSVEDRPLTFERATDLAEYLRWRNDLYAMTLAKRSVWRFVFRFALMKRQFDDYRARVSKPTLADEACFVEILLEKLSPSAHQALKQARKRYDRYEDVVDQVLRKAKKNRNFVSPKRHADFEAVVLKAVIDAVASRNKQADWTFRDAGLSQLSDDFLLLLEYLASYDSEDLKYVCKRFGLSFLTPAQTSELDTIQDPNEQEEKRLEILKPIIRPIWLLFVALCHSLQEGESNKLTASDAAWLGLIDEVIGLTEPESLRSIVEWEPDPPTPKTAALEQPSTNF